MMSKIVIQPGQPVAHPERGPGEVVAPTDREARELIFHYNAAHAVVVRYASGRRIERLRDLYLTIAADTLMDGEPVTFVIGRAARRIEVVTDSAAGQ